MTGGVPKLGRRRALVDQARASGGFMRVMATPPLMHGAAQWVSFGALHMGGCVVLQGKPEKLDPVDVLGSVERERCNMLTLVGDAFARPLLDHLKTTTYDLSGLYVIGSGGAILSPHFKQALLEQVPHAMVIDGFGASETGAQGSHATKAGDTAETGKFAMTTTVVLTQDLTGRLEPGSDDTGWLAKPGRVPLGYYKDAAKTAKTFPVIDGTRYAVPGDHAQIRADGTLVVLGRGSVCINSGGEKIYPEEVEQVLRKHPAVADAVVVGIPDERFGEQVTAVVQPREGQQLDHPTLAAFAAQHLARYKLPKTIVSSTRWSSRQASRTTAGPNRTRDKPREARKPDERKRPRPPHLSRARPVVTVRDARAREAEEEEPGRHRPVPDSRGRPFPTRPSVLRYASSMGAYTAQAHFGIWHQELGSPDFTRTDAVGTRSSTSSSRRPTCASIRASRSTCTARRFPQTVDERGPCATCSRRAPHRHVPTGRRRARAS
jgi:hypothetical protein